MNILEMAMAAKMAGGNGGGGGSGGVSSWNSITGKPFDENNIIKPEALPEGYPYKEVTETVIEWDGNTEGRPGFGNEVSGAYKVTEQVFDNLENCPVTFIGGNEVVELTLSAGIEAAKNIIAYSDGVNQASVLVVFGENDMGLETGTYFFKGHLSGIPMYISKLTDSDKTIHRIDSEFMPEGYPYIERNVISIFSEESVIFWAASDGVSQVEFDIAPRPFNPDANYKYSIVFDGEEYVCPVAWAKMPEGGSRLAGGNLSVIGSGDDTGEPFAFGLLTVSGSTLVGFVFYTKLSGDSHTISITDVSETVHTIDPVYLKLGNGLTIDENGALAVSFPSAEGGSF